MKTEKERFVPLYLDQVDAKRMKTLVMELWSAAMIGKLQLLQTETLQFHPILSLLVSPLIEETLIALLSLLGLV